MWGGGDRTAGLPSSSIFPSPGRASLSQRVSAKRDSAAAANPGGAGWGGMGCKRFIPVKRETRNAPEPPGQGDAHRLVRYRERMAHRRPAGGARSRCGAVAGPLNKGWGCRLTPHEQPGAPLCRLRWRFECFTGIWSVCCSRVDLKKKQGDVRPFKTLCALSVCAPYS